MPTRTLASDATPEHMKAMASELLKRVAEGDKAAYQILREFHPDARDEADDALAGRRWKWSDGLLMVAREHGFSSWARLSKYLSSPDVEAPSLESRITDQEFRRAVELIDDGDSAGLRGLLQENPSLITKRANFEGQNYFRNPALLAFVADNPVRSNGLPPNIVEIAKLLLDAGAKNNRADVTETLMLVASGRVARDCGVQEELIALLCAYGADPDRAVVPSLVHGEFAAAQALVGNGATRGLLFASAFGDAAEADTFAAVASPEERQSALALAAMHGRADVCHLLLVIHAVDPNRYNPIEVHSHSTPLHQAAWSGSLQTVRTLVDVGGAQLNMKDTLWGTTPEEWARHSGNDDVAQYLSDSAARMSN